MLSATFRAAVVLLLSAYSLAGCDSLTGSDKRAAGTYVATTFLVETQTGSVDLIDEGSDLELTLHRDGRTSGFVVIPGAGNQGADFSEDLDGTWTSSGSRVILESRQGSFLHGLEFFLEGDDLVHDRTGVLLILSRR